MLSRAAEQRAIPFLLQRLARADENTVSLLPRDVMGAVTLFDEDDTASPILYSVVPLIAIPRTHSFREAIGRWVFWNLAPLDSIGGLHAELRGKARALASEVTTEQQLSPGQGRVLSDFMAGWVEETFADVYATLAAGEDFAYEGIAWLRREAGDAAGLFDDDRLRPIPYLRPLSRIVTLESQGNDASALRVELAGLVEHLEAQPDQETIQFHIRDDNNQLIEEVNLPLPVIQLALGRLAGMLVEPAQRAYTTGIQPAIPSPQTASTYASGCFSPSSGGHANCQTHEVWSHGSYHGLFRSHDHDND